MKTMMLFILEIKVLIKTIMVMVSVVMIMTVMSLFQVYSSVLIFNSNCRLVFFLDIVITSSQKAELVCDIMEFFREWTRGRLQ